MVFTPKLEYDKKASIITNLKAIINWTNFLLQEMTVGRVINTQNKTSELDTAFTETKENVTVNDECIMELANLLSTQEECIMELAEILSTLVEQEG